MLTLTRKAAQQIYIETPAGRITIVVFFADRGRATLGIKAPAAFNIARAELVDDERRRA